MCVCDHVQVSEYSSPHPQLHKKCVSIAVGELLPALVVALRSLLEPIPTSEPPLALDLQPDAVTSDTSSSSVAAESSVDASLASPLRFSEAAWVSPRAVEAYTVTLAALARVVRSSAVARGSSSADDLLSSIAQVESLLLSTCGALASLPNDLIRRDPVAACECMRAVSNAVRSLLGHASPLSHQLAAAFIEPALCSTTLQRRRWGLDELSAYLLSLESTSTGVSIDDLLAAVVSGLACGADDGCYSGDSSTRPSAVLRAAARWLMGPRVRFLELLLGESTHEELLRRSGQALRTLVRSKYLMPEHVERLWSAVLTVHATSVDAQRDLLVTFVESAASASPVLVMHLFNQVRSTAEDPAHFADVALAVAKFAQAVRKEVEAEGKSVASFDAFNTVQRGTSSMVTDVNFALLELFCFVTQHRFAPTLGQIDAGCSANRGETHGDSTHDDYELADDIDGGDSSVSSSSDDDGGSCSIDEATRHVKPVKSDCSVSCAPTDSNAQDSLDAGSATALLQSSPDSAAADLDDAALLQALKPVWLNDVDTVRMIESALETVTDGIIRLLDAVCRPDWTQSVIVLALDRLNAITIDRNALKDTGLLERVLMASRSQSPVAISAGSPFSFVDEHGRAATFRPASLLALLLPSTDSVPRILDLMKRVIRHVHRNSFALESFTDDSGTPLIRYAFNPAHDVMMTTVVQDLERGVLISDAILTEAMSFSRHAPPSPLRSTSLARRLGFLYTLQRYNKQTKFRASDLRALFAAVNRWPSDNTLKSAAAVASLGSDASLAQSSASLPRAAGVELSTGALRDIAALVVAPRSSKAHPSSHDLREVFWQFLRRLMGGGSYDALTPGIVGPSVPTCRLLGDPEEFVVAPSPISTTSAFDSLSGFDFRAGMRRFPQRAGDAKSVSQNLLSLPDIASLWSFLFEPTDVSRVADGLPTNYATPTRTSTTSSASEVRRAILRSSSPASLGAKSASDASPIHVVGSIGGLPHAEKMSSDARRRFLSVIHAAGDLDALIRSCSASAIDSPGSIGPLGFDAFLLLWIWKNSATMVDWRSSGVSACSLLSPTPRSAPDSFALPPRSAQDVNHGVVKILSISALEKKTAVPSGSNAAVEPLAVSVVLDIKSVNSASSDADPPDSLCGLDALADLSLLGCSAVSSRASALLVEAHVALRLAGLHSWEQRALTGLRVAGSMKGSPLPLHAHPFVSELTQRLRVHPDILRSPRALNFTQLTSARCIHALRLYIQRFTSFVLEEIGKLNSPQGVTSDAQIALPVHLQSHRLRCGDLASAQERGTVERMAPAILASPLRLPSVGSVTSVPALAKIGEGLCGFDLGDDATPPRPDVTHRQESTSSSAGSLFDSSGIGTTADDASIARSASIPIPGLLRSTLSVSFSQRRPIQTSGSKPPDAFFSALWSSLQLSDALYDLLFGVLGSSLCHGNSGLRESVWSLIQELPTSPAFDGALTNPAGVQWSDLLSQPVGTAGRSVMTSAAGASAPAKPVRPLFDAATQPRRLQHPTSSPDDVTASELDGDGEGWKALYCLQAVAARIMRDPGMTAVQSSGRLSTVSSKGTGAASKAAPASMVSWRSEFVEANGLRVVMQQLLRAAPPSNLLHMRSLTTPLASQSFDPRLSRDITAVAARILLHSRDVLRDKDLQIKVQRGAKAVKAEAGLRMLLGRLIQALWIAAGYGYASLRHASRAAVKGSGSRDVDFETGVTVLSLIKALLARDNLITPLATGGSTKLNVLQLVGIDVFRSSDTLAQLSDLLACPARQLQQQVLANLVLPAIQDPMCGASASTLFSSVVSGKLQRLPPTSNKGVALILAVRDIVSADRRPGTALRWLVCLIQLIFAWWADASESASSHDNDGTSDALDVPDSDISIAPAQPAAVHAPLLGSLDGLPAALLKYVYVSPTCTPSATTASGDAPSTTKLSWKILHQKPLLSACLTLICDLMDAAIAASRSSGMPSILTSLFSFQWPRAFGPPPAETVLSGDVSGGVLAHDGSSEVAANAFFENGDASFEDLELTSSVAAIQKSKRRLTRRSRLVAPRFEPLWLASFEALASCCLFGPIAGYRMRALSRGSLDTDALDSPAAHSRRAVYLCHDQAERKSAFACLRRLKLQMSTIDGLRAKALCTLQTVISVAMSSSISFDVVSGFNSNDDSVVTFSQSAEEEAGRAESGFVGLVNLGCTCYNSALIQQLYMTPEFRKLVLQASLNALF
jgi:hypothetical protein